MSLCAVSKVNVAPGKQWQQRVELKLGGSLFVRIAVTVCSNKGLLLKMDSDSIYHDISEANGASFMLKSSVHA